MKLSCVMFLDPMPLPESHQRITAAHAMEGWDIELDTAAGLVWLEKAGMERFFVRAECTGRPASMPEAPIMQLAKAGKKR